MLVLCISYTTHALLSIEFLLLFLKFDYPFLFTMSQLSHQAPSFYIYILNKF